MTKKLTSITLLMTLITLITFTCAPSLNTGGESKEIIGNISYKNTTGTVGNKFLASMERDIKPSSAGVTYSLTPATLPEGVTFDSATGTFHGTPKEPFDSTAGDPYSVTVTGIGKYTGSVESDPFTIVVSTSRLSAASELSITEYTISYITLGLSLGSFLPSIFRIPTSTIPEEATVTYSLTPATLPEGVTFDSATGTFSGDPTEVFDSIANPYRVTVTGTGNYTGTINSDRFNLSVFKIPVGGLEIYYESTWYDIGETVSLSPVIPTLADVSYTYSVTSGSLPDGLTLNPSTGLIFGTSNKEASANLRVTAVAAEGHTGFSVTDEFSITITNRVELGGSFSYPSSTILPAGDPVNISISQSNLTPSDATIRYEAHGRFPAKLFVNPDTGAIEVSPGETIGEGTYTGQIRVVGTGVYKGTIHSNRFTIKITRVKIGGSFSYPSNTTISTHPRYADDPTGITISQSNLTPSDATIRYEAHGIFLPTGLFVNPETGAVEGRPNENTPRGTYGGHIKMVGTGAYKGTVYSNEFLIKITNLIPLTGSIDYTYYPYRCIGGGGTFFEDCISDLVTFNFRRPPNVYPVIATGTVLEAQRNGGLKYITRYYNPSTREFEVWRAFWGLTDPARHIFFDEDTGAFSKDPDFLHARMLAYNKPFTVYTFRVTAIGIGDYTGTVSRVINVEMPSPREFEYP